MIRREISVCHGTVVLINTESMIVTIIQFKEYMRIHIRIPSIGFAIFPLFVSDKIQLRARSPLRMQYMHVLFEIF